MRKIESAQGDLIAEVEAFDKRIKILVSGAFALATVGPQSANFLATWATEVGSDYARSAVAQEFSVPAKLLQKYVQGKELQITKELAKKASKELAQSLLTAPMNVTFRGIERKQAELLENYEKQIVRELKRIDQAAKLAAVITHLTAARGEQLQRYRNLTD